ncbi:FxLYD domain-containing protein [Yersinia enterocolitica]
MKKTLRNIIFTVAMVSGSVLAVDGSQQVSLSDLRFATTPNGMQQIEGNGINITSQTLKHVFVKFNLLQNNTVVGQTIAMVENLEAGQRWKVQAPYNSFAVKPDSFKVTEVDVIN